MVFSLISVAYAMAPAAGEGAKGGGGFSAFIPLILMFVIFYFLLIRPQQSKAKKQANAVDSAKAA